VSQQINLFNPVFLKQRKVFTARAMGRALAVLLVGGLAMVWYGQQSVARLKLDVAATARQLASKKLRQEAVGIEFAPRQLSQTTEAEIARTQAELAALRSAAGVLKRGEFGNTDGFSGYFKALARQNVPGLWLTGVSVSGERGEIGVRGRALDATLVPGYLGRLSHEAVMRGKTFGSLQISQPAKEDGAALELPPYVEFSLQSEVPEEDK
jgi:hypothetical protein